MVKKVYPSGVIESKDPEKKRFVVNVKRIKFYNVGGREETKIELLRFKDL